MSVTIPYLGETVIPRRGTKWCGKRVGGVSLFVERVADDGLTEPYVYLSSTEWPGQFIYVQLGEFHQAVQQQEDDDAATRELGLHALVLLALSGALLVTAVQVARSSTVGAAFVAAASAVGVGYAIYRKWSKR
ncbi:hypothetical protein N8J89_07780 [Crossiella sp. CA-258035]|uniref:hypothetical protein n=1 Tax=Crossiella sp. CA-258035 TaxID=2981138 RepID=UPI0024BD3FF3|nr:hypothetical protein [Crossiella sp. CA-258035]WHT20953.1 hypothetical protein N8J89_07780 [Crossiella sp. CA-258035]